MEQKYLNNVRVNGILTSGATDQMYLLGVLNGPVGDFVFRRIGKPKQGGWYEANKQFIAPLPDAERLAGSERRHCCSRAASSGAMDASPPFSSGGGRPTLCAGAGEPSGALAVA